jgi:hypothetical protein
MHGMHNIRMKLKHQISWKSIQCEASCFIPMMDGQTDLMKLIDTFRNFTNDKKFWDNCTLNNIRLYMMLHAINIQLMYF